MVNTDKRKQLTKKFFIGCLQLWNELPFTPLHQHLGWGAKLI